MERRTDGLMLGTVAFISTSLFTSPIIAAFFCPSAGPNMSDAALISDMSLRPIMALMVGSWFPTRELTMSSILGR